MSDSNFAMVDDRTLILAWITWWVTNGKTNTAPTQTDVQTFLLNRRKTYAMDR